jgi:hypothetical protein
VWKYELGLSVDGVGGPCEDIDQVDMDSFDKDIVMCSSLVCGECGDFAEMLLCSSKRSSGVLSYLRHESLV